MSIFYISEEELEYEMMYSYVMRDCKKKLKTEEEIIRYLVSQCYHVDVYNDILTEQIEKIKAVLGIEETLFTEIKESDLPF